MRIRLMGALLVQLVLVGCSTEARWDRFTRTEGELMQAREVASIECENEQACSDLWARTIAYVSTHSATRIAFADENNVETKRPLESGVVYLWAIRTPSPNNEHRARIRIKALCRGMYAMDGGPGWQYARCAREIETLERQYGEVVLTPQAGPTKDPARLRFA